MTKSTTRKLSLSLHTEVIKLPPFKDILVLGKNCSHGKLGLARCLDLMVPDEFELIEIAHPNIEAIFVNKSILMKIEIDKILNVLNEQVFPSVGEAEMIKVDIDLKFTYVIEEGDL